MDEQKKLIEETRERLKKLLDTDDPAMLPMVRYDLYRDSLIELIKRYHNVKTLEFGIEIMHIIYNQKVKKDFTWMNKVEKASYMLLLSEAEEEN